MSNFYAALDSIILGTRQPGLLNEEERRLVAYHEAGHAIVAWLTPGSEPVRRVSIIPHGRALGATLQTGDEDRRNYTRGYLVGRLNVLLGGRAAEDIVFGEPSTGAESDLKSAADLARRMVGIWGMDKQLGPVWYGFGETHPYLGRQSAQSQEYSEITAARVDSAVRQIIEDAHQNAVELLRKNRSVLDALVGRLLVQETIDEQEFNALLNTHLDGNVREGTNHANPSEDAETAAPAGR